jgi:hypothetical protein
VFSFFALFFFYPVCDHRNRSAPAFRLSNRKKAGHAHGEKASARKAGTKIDNIKVTLCTPEIYILPQKREKVLKSSDFRTFYCNYFIL